MRWVYLSGYIFAQDEADSFSQSPIDFIRVIAGFSYLSPEQLGWDPTFQAWNGRTGVPSYCLPLARLKGCSSPYEIPWVIDGPVIGSLDAEEKYVSIRSLTLGGAQMLYGRGSIVLEVVRFGDWIARNIEVL